MEYVRSYGFYWHDAPRGRIHNKPPVLKKSRKQRPISIRRSRLLLRLKAQRALTIDEISLRTNLSRTLVTDYLAGEEMYFSDAVALAMLFDLSLDDLKDVE